MEVKYETPSCFTAEKYNPYPLCVGQGMERCNNCCLYVDMVSPYDEPIYGFYKSRDDARGDNNEAEEKI